MKIRNSKKLLSVKTDPELDFKDRLDGIIESTSRKKKLRNLTMDLT